MKREGRFKMRVEFVQLLSCITDIAILLSGCSDVQNGSNAETFIPPSSETTQAADNVYSSDMCSDTEDSLQPKTPEESNLPESQANDSSATEENMTLQIGNSSFTVTLESNAAVDALVDMMRKAPVVIQMSDYSGFEKVGSLETSLPTSNRQTTTKSGDIVLYNGNQIVIFYGSNSWSYTRLGKVDDLSGWEDALGSGDAAVTFSLG